MRQKAGTRKRIATSPEEDRAMATGKIHRKRGLEFVCVVPEICEQTDRQTNRVNRQTLVAILHSLPGRSDE